ncbi:perilipin-2-like isoform X1 [Heliangelus exortis]|uniref:perilipin-2-like isoform X1 n=1 Tax=Heliangelus exortis TaxID=472823 RepID=UPI003A8E93F5
MLFSLIFFLSAAAEFRMASQKKTTKQDLKAEEQHQVNAVDRVTSLPLLSSAFNLVSSAYNHTKETHPCLSSVCSVVETVAAAAGGSVAGGAQPILNQLEPQIALVNECACKGLNQLEEKLPFLQQPADKVLSDTKQLVSTTVMSAVDAACQAKGAVAEKVTEAVDLTKNVVGDSVKLTKSVVTSTVNSAVGAAQGAKDLVATKVTEAVDVTKHLVEDKVEQTKAAVASTFVSAVEAAQGAKDLVSNKVSEAVDVTKHLVEDKVEQTKATVASTFVSAVEAAQGAKDLVATKVTEAVDLTKHVVEDKVEQTKAAVSSTISAAVGAAQGAKDLVTNKVTEAVDVTKHMVEDKVEQTKAAVSSTFVNAVEAAQGAKDLVSNKVSEAVGVTKHLVEDKVEQTKAAVSSTISAAVGAAQGAKDLVTNKVTEAVDVTKHLVEDKVEQTKAAVASTFVNAVEAAQGAKELVATKVTEAVDLTKGAVQDGVEKTKSMVTSTVSTALDSAYGTISSKINTSLEQGKEAIQEGVEKTNSVLTNSISKAKAVSQVVAGGAESLLGISQDLVDNYLPVTEEELGQLATAVEGFAMASVEEQKEQQSYFVCLGSLSNKIRGRAYRHSLHKLQHLKQSTQDSLSRLQLVMNLIESLKQEVGQKLLDGQKRLHRLWVDWCLTQPKGNQVKTASYVEVEARTLAMLRIITQQLQHLFETLKASIQGLPSNIQEPVYQATRNIHKLHSSFFNAMSFQDLSSTTLTQSQDHVAEAQRSLDDLFEYVAQNIPLSWVVGPFRAIAEVSQGGRKEKTKDRVTCTRSAVWERAPSSKEVATTPKELKGATRIPGEGCEVLEKLEEKAEQDTEVALAAKVVTTNAPEEEL